MTFFKIYICNFSVWGMLLVVQLVEALHYKPEGNSFNSRWCQWNFSLNIPYSRTLWPWGRLSL